MRSGLLAGTVVALGLALPAAAQADTTFAVDTFADTPVGQDCIATPTACSLRQAVTSANLTSGPDIVNLPGGTYELANGANGELLVTEELRIQRIGATRAVIDANGTSRVIATSSGVALTLSRLDVREGRLSSGAPAAGAGILARGPLTLDDVTVAANRATGDAVVGVGVAHTDALVATGSRFLDNDGAATSGSARGGGIGAIGSGAVTITDGTFSGNEVVSHTVVGGGAAFINGATTMERVMVEQNSARNPTSFPGDAYGGGIDQVAGPGTYTEMTFVENVAESLGSGTVSGGALSFRAGALSVSGSSLARNEALAGTSSTARGGGLFVGAATSASLTRSRITDSTASGGEARGGGLAGGLGVTMTVSRSTLDANLAQGTADNREALGGGAHTAGTLAFAASTIYGNAARVSGNGSDAVGGGLHLTDASMISSSTVTANDVSGGGVLSTTTGAGIAGAGTGASVSVIASIVANNPGAGSTEDCQGVTVASYGGNVRGVPGPGACPVTTVSGTETFTSDALLDPLGDYTGPTPTVRLQPGSPALDRNAELCSNDPDQRGVDRPQGATCDAGAFEARLGRLTTPTASRAFGDQETGTTSPAQTVTFTNEGDLPTTPAVSLGGSDPSQFTVSGCGASVAPSATCDASVRFAPTTAGTKTAALLGGVSAVNLSGTGVLAAPSCDPVSATTAYDTMVAIPTDCTGATSNAVASSPSNGSTSVSGAVITYTPSPGFIGTDTFTYTGSGPGGTSAPATVTVTVDPPPAPVCSNATLNVPYETAGTATLMCTGVLGSRAIADPPDHGTLGPISADSVTYTPDDGYRGADSFTFTASGPGGTSAPATIAVNVAAPPPPPAPGQATCLDLAAATAARTPVDLQLPCGGAPVWSWEIVEAPAHGTLSAIGPRGALTYTPAEGFTGTDAFRYRGIGPAGITPPATATIAVAPGPAASPSSGPGPEPDPPAGAARCTVPDVVGRTIPRARELLREAGCGRPIVERKGKRLAGKRRIASQVPAAGTPLAAGERVELVARPRSRG